MKFIIDIYYFFIFFPYICLYRTNTDIQVYSVIFSGFILIILFSGHIKIKIPKKMLLVLFIFLSTICFLDFKFYILRRIYKYISFILIFIVTYNTLKIKSLTLKNIKVFINIYMIVGLIQVFFPTFAHNILSRKEISIGFGRGVSSLNPEPAYYASTMILIFLFLNLEKKIRKLDIYIIIFQILILAKSAIGGIYLLIYYLLDAFMRKEKVKILKIILIFFFISIGIFFLFPESRLSKLFEVLLFNPKRILKDKSIYLRFLDIYLSLKGSFENWLLPNGMSQWDFYKSSHLNLNEIRISQNISTLGGMIYELGFIMIIVLLIIYKNYKKSRIEFKINLIFLGIILFSPLQFSHPIIPMYIAYSLNKKEVENEFVDNSNTNI